MYTIRKFSRKNDIEKISDVMTMTYFNFGVL